MNTFQVIIDHKNKKKSPQRICTMYTDPAGNNVRHGEDTWLMTDGKLQQKSTWKHDMLQGIEIMNYAHKGNFNKLYLARTHKNHSSHGVEVYFHKH